MSAVGSAAAPSKAWSRVGWSLVAVGLVVIAVSLTFVILTVGSAVKDGLSGQTYATPMDAMLTLRSGDYLVYELTGQRSQVDGATLSQTNGTTLAPQDVRVTDPDGHAVRTWYPNDTSTIDRGGTVYTGAIGFHAARGGRYEIIVDDPGSSPRVLVSPDIARQFLRVLPWILGLVAGAPMLMAGTVLLIVYWTRKGRASRLPPAGWYPDPSAPGGARWWNGYTWAPPGS